eukprot:CAMPEP_0182945486 /NCGR_PEP_ID=MMETSP0105_2-20130417/55592_1 /TAXON_ID=81532 ORGANISM="Acanthoeca-like sp., Strain 10tr" /NCGR_SAMPLE_ID=MMETSP0105_2 /ASSEMBLY_ACC=CAM_ASM_000205 /LENGTH=85 /DNA_ID=CAMNT_0025085511 /DNA_START=336 /DNA_END=590 /DNA_ORIENTATION=+
MRVEGAAFSFRDLEAALSSGAVVSRRPLRAAAAAAWARGADWAVSGRRDLSARSVLVAPRVSLPREAPGLSSRVLTRVAVWLRLG